LLQFLYVPGLPPQLLLQTLELSDQLEIALFEQLGIPDQLESAGILAALVEFRLEFLRLAEVQA
jgi:hypothetical protein